MDDIPSSIERAAEALDKIIKEKQTPKQQRHIERGYGGRQSVKPRLKVLKASEVKSQPIEWLFPGKIALGKITLIAGDPGLGKSLVTADIAAHVSTATDWPTNDGKCPLGDVLMVSGEDDPGDTIRPRLEAAGADLTRVHIVEHVESVNSNGNTETRMLSLRQDIETMREHALTLPQCRLIIIDPISAYLDGADSHNNASVRALLAPLSEFARASGAAIVLVTHLNKGRGGPAIHRATGSLAFVAAGRAAFVVVRDKQDPERRLLLTLKNNVGPDTSGMAYRIEEVGGVPKVVWEEEPVLLSADDALRQEEGTDGQEMTLVDSAAEWLKELLADGPVASNDVRAEAKEAGFHWPTVRRAQAKLRIKPQRMAEVSGESAWYWALPE